MAKINLNLIPDLDEVVTPRSGHVGLLEGRRALHSLWDSDKWDLPFRDKAEGRKPRGKDIRHERSTALSVRAYSSQVAGLPVEEEIGEGYSSLADQDWEEWYSYLLDNGWQDIA
jgi:hypothetical protein